MNSARSLAARNTLICSLLNPAETGNNSWPRGQEDDIFNALHTGGC